VVAFAEQDEVGDAGLPSVDPMHQVMGFALDGWGAADHTATVAGVQCESHGCGDEAFGGTNIEWLGLGAEDDGDDLGVAGDAAYGGCGQAVAEDGVADRVGGRGLEGVVVDGDGEVGLRTMAGNVCATVMGVSGGWRGGSGWCRGTCGNGVRGRASPLVAFIG
jgi:hypothetical protein